MTEEHMLSRRQVLAGLLGTGVVTIVGTSSVAGAMRALAVPQAVNDRVLVNVFLRGGADGLNIVVPAGDADYYQLRGSIAQQPGTLSDLDGFFGLSQPFAALHPLYQQGELAIVHAAGSHDLTRSHFSAMDNMDLAFGQTGWMQRVLWAEGETDPVSAISIDDRTSPSLRGPNGGLAFDRLNEFRNTTDRLSPMRSTLEAMYGAADPLTRDATINAFASVDRLRDVDTTPDVPYPNSSIARDLREAAALIKAEVGVRMVSINFGGWDHHSDENPRLIQRGTQLAEALAAFSADLGSHRARVMTVVMSEFGRAAEQNGGGGTDHGHGNMMMLLGGALSQSGGGAVHLAEDTWVGLRENDLHQGRDLAITTDFRSVLSEVLDRHLGFTDLAAVFSGFTPQYLNFLDPVNDPPPPPPPPPPDPGPGPGPGPGPDGTVSGTVRYTGGAGAARVTIDLFAANDDGTRGEWQGDTRTDAEGRYRFTAPADDYILTFIAPTGGSFVGGRRWAQPSVTIMADQDTAGVDAELISGGPQDASIGGAVSDGAGPVGAVLVDLFLANGDGSRGLWLAGTTTGDDGRYRFGVQPGCYVVTFVAPTDRRFVDGGAYYQPGLCVDANQRVDDLSAVLV